MFCDKIIINPLLLSKSNKMEKYSPYKRDNNMNDLKLLIHNDYSWFSLLMTMSWHYAGHNYKHHSTDYKPHIPGRAGLAYYRSICQLFDLCLLSVFCCVFSSRQYTVKFTKAFTPPRAGPWNSTNLCRIRTTIDTSSFQTTLVRKGLTENWRV